VGGVVYVAYGVGAAAGVASSSVLLQKIGDVSQLSGRYNVVFGPTARGDLNKLAENINSSTWSNKGLWGEQYPHFATAFDFTKGILDKVQASGGRVLFDLTNMKDVPGVLTGRSYVNEVTSQELRYIVANWDRFKNTVDFLDRNAGGLVKPPWMK
jgi:hypothetical protein